MPDDIGGGGADKRVERRVAAVLPVTLGNLENGNSKTRDVSASGLFFETDASLAPGAEIHLAVEIDTPAGRRVLKCQGTIVRVERLENRLGCAVKIVESLLVRPA